MKKATTTKRKAAGLIVKNLIILLVITVAAFSGTQSWFTTGASTTASGVSVKTDQPDKLQFAIVPAGSGYPTNENKWVDGDILLNAENYPNLFANLFLSDIDGNGTTFTKPMMVQSGVIARPNLENADTWETATANVDYLSVDIYSRVSKSSSYKGVKLNADSYIKPSSAVTAEPTPDAVIGAVRFSFKDSASSNIYIWIPGANVYFDETSKTVNTAQTASSSISLPAGVSGDTFTHYYYTISGAAATLQSYPANKTFASSSGYTIGSASNFNTYSVTNKTKFITYNGTSSDSKYKYGYATCKLWIAGEDTEARLATVGGKFKIELKFDAVNS